jgi:hypothetical protein
MKWITNLLNSLIHWVSFGIIASFLPITALIHITQEPFWSGVYRVLTEASLKGDVVLLMIPLVGGLIGETVVRSFYSKGLETLAAISGIFLLALLVSYANEFHSLDISHLSVTTQEYIISSTQYLFGFMLMYALAVMALSSSQTKGEGS